MMTSLALPERRALTVDLYPRVTLPDFITSARRELICDFEVSMTLSFCCSMAQKTHVVGVLLALGCHRDALEIGDALKSDMMYALRQCDMRWDGRERESKIRREFWMVGFVCRNSRRRNVSPGRQRVKIN